jgi:hypothetical protein
LTLYPAATARLIAPGANDPGIVPVGVVLHVAVSEATSLYDYFRSGSGGVESHLYVRYDGSCEQYRDLDFEADAQSAGNSWVAAGQTYGFLSVETQGLEAGTWTSQQIAAIKDFIGWSSDHYRFPLRVCPAYHASGVGYHRLFPQWNPNHHVCPGDDRVRQFTTVIAPWLAAGAHMDLTEQNLKDIAAAVWQQKWGASDRSAMNFIDTLDEMAASKTWTARPWSSPDPGSTAIALQQLHGWVKEMQSQGSTGGGALTLSDADKDDIARRVADLLAARLAT